MSTDTITRISIDDLHESPFNPRKIFDEDSLVELATDIRQQGVMSPLLVRPRRAGPLFGDDPESMIGFEIVFGHRRFRAAQLANQADLPCMVKAMNDDEVRRAQISENLQRRDVHPIEEAEGFQALMFDDQMTADEIAEQFGKSRSYVYGRLKLLEAVPSIRDACLRGEIGSEVALLIARLRKPGFQEKALEYIKKAEGDDALEDGGKASFREIRSLLNRKFTLDLADAIFDVNDEMLVPAAGYCGRCPKRSGNAAEFEDVATAERGHTYRPNGIVIWNAGTDVCTDPDCFDEKKKAHLAREAAKLEAAGATVLQGTKARAVFDGYGGLKAGFVPVATVRKALEAKGKELKAATVLTVLDQAGKVHEVVRSEDAKSAGVKVREPAPAYNAKAEQEKRAQLHAAAEAKAKTETAVRRLLLERVRAAAAATERSAFDLQMVAQVALAGVAWHDKIALADLHGTHAQDLEEHVAQMDMTAVALFMLDCALIHRVDAEPHNVQYQPEALLEAAKHYGIDEAAVRAELAGPVPTPTAAARAPTKSKGSAPTMKYRNAHTGETWSGRGLQPKWLKVALAAGRTIDEFDITKAASEAVDQKIDAGVAGGSDAQAELEEATS